MPVSVELWNRSRTEGIQLGIPTVIDRIIQQAMLQQLMPIYEPLFSDDNFGYRPGRGKRRHFQDKKYIEQG